MSHLHLPVGKAALRSVRVSESANQWHILEGCDTEVLGEIKDSLCAKEGEVEGLIEALQKNSRDKPYLSAKVRDAARNHLEALKWRGLTLMSLEEKTCPDLERAALFWKYMQDFDGNPGYERFSRDVQAEVMGRIAHSLTLDLRRAMLFVETADKDEYLKTLNPEYRLFVTINVCQPRHFNIQQQAEPIGSKVTFRSSGTTGGFVTEVDQQGAQHGR